MRASLHRLLGLFAAVVAVAGFVPAAFSAGLLAPTDHTLPPLRVTNHLVDAAIHDQIALTTLTQTFHNDTNRRLEATYVFPLPENADLTDFQMTFNGKMVQGEVLPAEQARQIYESIVRQSRDPGLIEFIGRRLLQMRVFPIESNSDTTIQVKYQQICKPSSGMNAYHYPLRTCKPTHGQAYGTVRFALTLDSTAPLKNIWSPTHAVEIVRDGEHNAKIAYEASHGSLEDDFILLYDTDKSDLGMSVIAYQPVASMPGHFVLTLTPKQLWPEQEYQPQDVVFVIDTSGSMAGEKIDQAKAALKFCIDKLDERDRFSIVRFSTGFDVLFQELKEASRDRRAEARMWVDKFTSAGGTNIHDALKGALDLRPKNLAEHRPFVIVFITDGMANTPPEDTMKMIAQHPSSTGARIFSFGVGHDVNTVFLDQVAVNYSGKPTYVQPGENLELVLGDFFAVISQPVLTNLRLALPEIGVTEQFPATLGDLYHGQQLIIAGRFDKPLTGPVKLTATRNGQPVEFAWPNVSFTNTAEAAYVPSIWAGRKISFLIDQIRAHGENPELVTEVLALGQQHRIQTPYTSWLVNPDIEFAWQRGRVPPPPPGRYRPMPMPGERGGASGGGLRVPGAGGREAGQRRALEGHGVDVESGGGINGFGDESGRDVFALSPETLMQESGADATTIARRNAEMRENKSKDGGRVNEAILAARFINGRWYNRIGQFFVDEELTETAEITIVKFGSTAYFHLVNRRSDLRPALAASPSIVVLTAENAAVLVSETDGIEEFSQEQLEHLGLAPRTDP